MSDYDRNCENVLSDSDSYRDYLVECEIILREESGIEMEDYTYEWLGEYRNGNGPNVAVDNFLLKMAEKFGMELSKL